MAIYRGSLYIVSMLEANTCMGEGHVILCCRNLCLFYNLEVELCAEELAGMT